MYWGLLTLSTVFEYLHPLWGVSEIQGILELSTCVFSYLRCKQKCRNLHRAYFPLLKVKSYWKTMARDLHNNAKDKISLSAKVIIMNRPTSIRRLSSPILVIFLSFSRFPVMRYRNDSLSKFLVLWYAISTTWWFPWRRAASPRRSQQSLSSNARAASKPI